MAALLVVIVSLFVVAAVWRRNTLPLRDCILTAAVILGGFVAASTELLSLFHALRYQPVLIVWCLAGVMSLVMIVKPGRASPKLDNYSFSWFDLAPMLVIAAITLLTLLTVCYCPPNNFDVILYHLPRQIQWLQQGSVAHFPTQDYRLTVNPPFMEYAGLHLMTLTGSDRFYVAVSWVAMLLTLLAVSVLARDLVINRAGQWLAAAFAATVPMSIHESVSGKNDGLVALWLTLSVIQLLRLWNAERIAYTLAALFGTTLGLLILTKGTGGVFAMPVVLLFALRWLKSIRDARTVYQVIIEDSAPMTSSKPRQIPIVIAALVGIPIIALNAGHWYRNVAAYGSVTGQTFGLANETHTPKAFASNLLRNLAMHLATPRDDWNHNIERFVQRQHNTLGIPCDDPATTWGGNAFTLEHAPQREHAAAPIHLLLLVILLFGSLPWIRQVNRQWWLFIAIVAGGGITFCIAFKWQPWHPRLHLPLFALASVIVGALFSRKEILLASPLAVIALFGACLPALVISEYRPLIATESSSIFKCDRETLRLLGREDVRGAAEFIVNKTHGRVAIIDHGALPWEYPLTRRLKAGYDPRTVGYFYPVAGSPPAMTFDFVIAIGDSRGPEWVRQPGWKRDYHAIDCVGPFTLYVPGDAPLDATVHHAIGRFGVGAEPPERN